MNSILERRNLDINLELIFLFNYSFITIKNSDINEPINILFLSITKFSINLIKLFNKLLNIIFFNIWP